MGMDKLHKMGCRIGCLLLAGILLFGSGCTRRFFRDRADNEVERILAHKNRFPQWQIENWHVYPNPQARFADDSNPDRPPMPPDDPAARMTAPNPQRPGPGGVRWMEGTGYLDLLARWDAENRAIRREQVVADLFGDMPMEEVRRIAAMQEEKPGDGEEGPAPKEETPVNGAFLLRLDQAVELGLINNREYQSRRENLYLSALPVTLERFAFSTQFFALEQAVRQQTGRDSVSGQTNQWRLDGATGFSKLFPNGALLLLAWANRTVVNLTGSGPHTISISDLDLDIVQPLLRGGGRAVTLEPLTQAERDLLYDIRSYARFRKEFFQHITGGGDLFQTGAGLGRIGGGSQTPGTTRLNSGNPAAPRILPGGAGALALATGSQAPSEGYLPTLLRQAFLGTEKKNVATLEYFLNLFRSFEEGGDISSLQVGQVELNLLQARAAVLQRQQDLRDSLDRFKLQLGVPTPLPLELDDQPLRPVARQLERFEEVIDQNEKLIARMGKFDSPTETKELRGRLLDLFTNSAYVRPARQFRKLLPVRWAEWEKLDAKGLERKLEETRQARRKLLERQTDLQAIGQDLSGLEKEELIRLDRQVFLGDFERVLRRYEGESWKAKATPREQAIEQASQFRDVRVLFVLILQEAGNERLEGIRRSWPNLPPILVEGQDLLEGVGEKDADAYLEKAYEVVVRTALANRLDLMNARAQVVDAWRQVAVFANSLLGTFTVGYHMDTSTPADLARPLAFGGSRTRHQLFLNGELPLVRLAERNAYRASLIGFQRARRALMAAEDVVAGQVRTELRQLRVLAENFRIQQQAVELQYLQVESSLETFRAPAEPRATATGGNAASAAALTNQLLQAQTRLPAVQNQLFTIWVNYQIQRQQLFLDLEMLPLDFRGVWIDEFAPRPLGIRVAPGSETDLPADLHRARLVPPTAIGSTVP